MMIQRRMIAAKSAYVDPARRGESWQTLVQPVIRWSANQCDVKFVAHHEMSDKLKDAL